MTAALTAQPDTVNDARQHQERQRAVAAIMRNVAIDAEVEKLAIRTAAKDLFDTVRADAVNLPDVTNLTDFLAIADEPARYRIDDLWPVGGRVLLAAQMKAGKSTMVGNVTRALADGVPFLGRYTTHRAGRVVIVDNELDERTIRRWLREQNITSADRVDVVALRGKVSTFDLINTETRARWARQIGPADVLIFDCLRPVLDALGLSEDKEAGRFLVAFDALLSEAGIGEALLVHHAGHGSERARGDSRIQDWPDALWRLAKDGDEHSGPRYFTAFGRDVDVHEQRLAYEPLDRSLTIAGGSRSDAKIYEAAAAVLALLADQTEPISGAAIERGLTGTHPQHAVRKSIRKVIETGDVLTEDGPRGATLHYVNPSTSSAR